MPPDLITLTEGAARLGVERTTLFRWMQLGRIKPVMKLPGKTGALLFDPADIESLASPDQAAS